MDGSHDLSRAAQSIAQLQAREGRSTAFRRDMARLNEELQADGFFPNLEITGVDRANHKLITKDIADGRVVEQSPRAVEDFAALGSGTSVREAELSILSRALGLRVTRNGDGSYNVDASRTLDSMLDGLLGDGTRRGSGHEAHMPLGFRPFYERAWFPPASSGEA